MLWLKNILDWNKLCLAEKLEQLRKHYCTGPCGQSNNVLATRDVTNSVLQDAVVKVRQFDFMDKVLRFHSENDIEGMLYWWVEKDELKFAVLCSDLFWWGTSDHEELTIENFSLFEQSVEECQKSDPVLGAINGCGLFASRIRKMRPQGAAYPEQKELWPLFDACGPEREISITNPCKPGDYQR